MRNTFSEALSPEDILIPKQLGHIDETFTGTSGMTVFHIKDAHCNYYAQKSIRGLLEWFGNNYGVEHVGLEGAGGTYDMRVIEELRPLSVKRAVAEKYLKAGLLSGAEYYRVFSPGLVRLHGLEDTSLYEENLASYRDMLLQADDIEKFISSLEEVFGACAKEELNRDLAEFDKKRKLFDANDIPLEEYVGYLTDLAEKRDITLDVPESAAYLAELAEMEKKIDFHEAENDREMLFGEVLERVSFLERRYLLSEAANFTSGTISEARFYGFILRKAREVGITAARYPDLARYAEYARAYSQIDETRLLDQINVMEEALSEGLYRSPAEKELYDNIVKTRLLRKMFTLTISRRELVKAFRTVDAEKLAQCAAGHVTDKDTAGFIKKSALSAANGLLVMRRFYSIADKRDRAFLGNIASMMRGGGASKCAVVTGGFHAENLQKLFRKAGISYVSISPSFSNRPEYKNPYMSLLKNSAGAHGSMTPLPAFSAIQIKSLWSGLGLETDFVPSLLLRIDAVISAQKAKEAEGFFIQLGRKRLLLARSNSYHPVKAERSGRVGDTVIDLTDLVPFSTDECAQKLEDLDVMAALARLPADVHGNDVGQVIRLLVVREADAGQQQVERIPRKAFIRTYEGEIIAQPVTGPKNKDELHYALDIDTGVLVCKRSCGRITSAYMKNPRVIDDKDREGNHVKSEKKYLCDHLRKLYRPGLSVEKRKEMLRVLLDEQAEYEKERDAEGNSMCGWEWVIDRDAEGNILLDDALGFGLRSLHIFDRTRLPEGVTAQNLIMDAEKFGGEENVQEMVFDIDTVKEGKVEFRLTTNWAAEEEIKELEEALYTDNMTGLRTKKYLYEKWVPGLVDQDFPMSVIYIDADKFKHINDTYGHDAGDEVIRAVAGAISRSTRHSDLPIRQFQGDEFVVCLPGTDISRASVVTDNIRRRIASVDLLALIENLLSKQKKRGVESDINTDALDALRKKDPQDRKVTLSMGISEISGIDENIRKMAGSAAKAKVTAVETAITRSEKYMYIAKTNREREKNESFVYVGREEILKSQKRTRTEIPVTRTVLHIEQVSTAFENIVDLLEKFRTEEYVKGLEQGDDLVAVLNEIKTNGFRVRIESLLRYSDVLKDVSARMTGQEEEIASRAREEMRKLCKDVIAIKQKIDIAAREIPVPVVDDIRPHFHTILRIGYEYLTPQDYDAQDEELIEAYNGEYGVWVGDKCIIDRAFPAERSLASEKWILLHNDWHRELAQKYPGAMKASKEIAAVYFAFCHYIVLEDDQLEDLFDLLVPGFEFSRMRQEMPEVVEKLFLYLNKRIIGGYFLTQKKDAIIREAMSIIREGQGGEEQAGGSAVKETDDISDNISFVLERISKSLKEEAETDFEKAVIDREDIRSLLRQVLGILREAKSDPSERISGIENASGSLTRQAFDIKRFPAEKRVILYPVYDRTIFKRAISNAAEIQGCLRRSDHGFNVALLPYLAGDMRSFRQAADKMEAELDNDGTARAFIYDLGHKDMDFTGYATGRVLVVREEGVIPGETPEFSFVKSGLRLALALTAIDLFDERNNCKQLHRDRMKYIIESLLALISGDSAVIELFREDPANLINGVIVLRPAEKVSWEDALVRIELDRKFMRSL